MHSRIRIALGLALLLTLLSAIPALAKGSFAFITVTGDKLEEAVRLSDPALTADFFAFADFYRNKAEAPVDPGVGYELTRYYLDGGRESAFDKLHYYPDTGFVYYDGLVNGSSEYDGKWYTARPEIKSTFETALYTQIRLVALGTPDSARALVPPPPSAQPAGQPGVPIIKPEFILPIAIITSLAVILTLASWRRRSVAH